VGKSRLFYQAHGEDVARERAALYRAQRQKIDLQNAKLRGELVPRAIIAKVWERVMTNVRTRVLNVANLAAPLGAIRDTAKRFDRLSRELHAALEELSAERNAELVRHECEKLWGTDTGDLEVATAPAPANGEPMGRREPAAKSRARERARKMDDVAD
jgi:hypothetical protein